MIPDIISADPDWPYTKAKTAVLLAAAAVIREAGPRSATLKNIAAKAGITEPAIFRHFQGIDGLFAGLFSVYERIFQRLSMVYDRPEAGMARFLGAMEASVDIFAASHDFAYLVVHAEEIFCGYPELKARLAELKSRDREVSLACLREAVERGELRSDVDQLSVAIAFIGSIHFSIIMWINSGYAFDLRAFCARQRADYRKAFTPCDKPA